MNKTERVQRGWDENNLAEFPLAVLGDAAPVGVTTLEFQDEIDDWKTGTRVTRRVRITGSEAFGLPTSKDEEVLLALIQLTKSANDFQSSEVHFSKHEIIQILGWQNRGWAYRRIEESLHRWKSVSIHYWNAWRDHRNHCWRDSEALGVIEYFRLTDGRQVGARAAGRERSRFIWNAVLFQSFQAGYLKKLDFEIFRNLKRAAARRAYRFLDKRFFHKPDWEFDLHHFATQKLGFSKNYDTGQLKQQLRPALRELEDIGFIKPVSYSKLGCKRWKIAISRASKKPAQKRLSVATHLPEEREHSIEMLIARGVIEETARDLMQSVPEMLVREKLDFFDWLVRKNDRRIATNPPGFLVAAIRKNYPLSKDYLSIRKKIFLQSHASRKYVHTPVAAIEPEVVNPEYAAIMAFVEGQKDDTKTLWLEEALSMCGRLKRESFRRLEAQGGSLYETLRDTLLRDYVKQRQLHL